MNTKTILSLVFVASIFLTSCKKELEPQDSSETPLTEAAATPADPANPVQVAQPQVQATPAPAPVQTGQPVQQAPVAKTAPGMNPPHGQPNHRCDIAVGAPLNSPKGQTPPAPPAPKPATTVQKVNTPQPAATVTPTAPGMNPPHGQPGHRCEIAVGAPLPTE